MLVEEHELREKLIGYALEEDRVRQLAYNKWEEAGRPEGQADRFWFDAENDVYSSKEVI